jgi:hypothetical protein
MTATTEAKLSDTDRERLIKFLGMLGASHGGEQSNAARMANRVVKDAGTTWREVLEPIVITKKVRPEVEVFWQEPIGLAAIIKAIRIHVPRLTDWEVKFLKDMDGRQTCSPKQHAILDKLLDQARGHAHRPNSYRRDAA